ncbi:hypothetical protein ABPG75_012039 [Micractinium tetrahymenae]
MTDREPEPMLQLCKKEVQDGTSAASWNQTSLRRHSPRPTATTPVPIHAKANLGRWATTLESQLVSTVTALWRGDFWTADYFVSDPLDDLGWRLSSDERLAALGADRFEVRAGFVGSCREAAALLLCHHRRRIWRWPDMAQQLLLSHKLSQPWAEHMTAEFADLPVDLQPSAGNPVVFTLAALAVACTASCALWLLRRLGRVRPHQA